MNKKGIAVFIYFMMGVLFFVLGLALAPALTENSDEVREDLDCSNESISNQNKAICYQVDVISPVFIGVIFGIAGIAITRIVGL